MKSAIELAGGAELPPSLCGEAQMKLDPRADALREALLASTPSDLGFAAAGSLEGPKRCIRQDDNACGRPRCALASLVELRPAGSAARRSTCPPLAAVSI